MDQLSRQAARKIRLDWRALLRALLGAALLFMLAPLAHAALPAISAGGYHSVGARSDGSVRTWGDDCCGQLASGRVFQYANPLATSGISGVRAIAAGGGHTLALKNDGSVWTWGYNFAGQLGDGTTTDRSAPVQVSGLTGVIAVAAGDYHSVALKNDGSVWTWGYNPRGQLGDGTAFDRLTPVKVSALTGMIAISAGGGHTAGHTLALKNDGSVWAWGDNSHGQLGIGSTASRSTPVQVSALTGVSAISAGHDHSVALKSDGSVWAWGYNNAGQLGDGTTSDKTTAVRAGVLTGVSAISAGGGVSGGHTVALKSDGSVWAWGRNVEGQLGDGSTANRSAPVQVSGLSGVSAISAANGPTGSHTAAVKSDGSVWTWGNNRDGQLGDGTTANRSAPVRVGAVTGVVAISAGGGPTGGHTVAVKSDGSVWAWGDNSFGELGDGVSTSRSTPLQVSGLTGVVAVSGGEVHTVALKSDGSVWAWGYNNAGQLGDGTTADRSTPVQVIGLSGATAVAAGSYHTLALKSDGSVWAWGRNVEGQLGNSGPSSASSPAQVPGLTGVIAIAAGGGGSTGGHSVALKNDGSVWTWGYNNNGQLGDGSTNSRSLPVKVSGLAGVTAISAGRFQTLALKSDGSVWAWGNNNDGQVGDGTANNIRSAPVQVSGLSGMIAIATGGFHSMAIKSDGSVWAWGNNDDSQLGDGTTVSRPIPVKVGGLAGMAAVSAGGYHSVALKVDGSVVAWGRNNDGQLGDGTLVSRLAPVIVVRESGAGSIATSDWFLDLNPGIAKVIPDDMIPAFLAVSSRVGGDISAIIKYGASDVGKVGSVYVYALAPATMVKDAVVAEKHLGAFTNATSKAAPVACVLAQLNASGQLTAATANTLKAQLTGTIGQSQVVEVNKGVPPANVQGAVFSIGTGSTPAEMSRSGKNRSVATVSADQTCQPQAPQTGWWWNSNEGGRGFSIEARGNKLFMAGYFYDASGRATWMTSGGYTALDGSLFNEGTLLSYANGQTLTGSYKQPPPPTSGGTITLTFSDARHGTMFWPGGAVAIERADTLLGSATTQPAFVPENGWWWNKDESGRGYFMEFKNSFAFIAGYMYDGSGNPLWYLASGNMPNAQVFQSNWTQYANGQTMTGAYKPNTLVNANVGALSIQFTDASNATLTLPDNRKLAITRFRF